MEHSKNGVPNVVLSNGNKIPIIGLGTWRSEKGEVAEAVKAAVKLGYRHIDCASNYLNEAEIGDTLHELFKEGVVKREDLFITGKLNNPYHKEEHVLPHLEKTLLDLRLEYLDLWLMHWPVAFHYVPYDQNKRGYDKDYDPEWNNSDLSKFGGSKINYAVSIRETWLAMEKCVKQGKVKAIGVSNFTTALLHDLLSYATIKPVVNQVEMHIYLQQPKLRHYCKNVNVAIEAYSSLGTPGFKEKSEPVVLDDPVVNQIAKKHGKTAAQVCLRFLIQHGIIVLAKSVNPTRIKENFQLFDFKLSEEEIKSIEKVDRRYRFLRPFDWYQINLFDDN